MKEKVFNIKTALEFKDLTLQVFEYQFKHNNVYRSFCDLLNVHPSDVENLDEIPFLPIEFFKSHKVLSSVKEVQKIFSSSGTTGKKTSRHLVTDLGWYQQSYCEGFKHFYGNIEQYTVLALLPGYLERDDSSLVYMVHDLINKKYSLTYYLEVGDQKCNEPGILKLYDPYEEILPNSGTIAIFPASRKHSVVYSGKTERVMIGINFYSL